MLRSATLLPSGARSGPSRENQNDSVRSVASAGTATGWTITNCDAGWGPQLPSERPPIRAANRPVRTIAAVVPPSWRSTRLTPPKPSHGASPSSKPPFCSSSCARAARGASGPDHKETQRSRPRRPNTTSETAVGRFLTFVPGQGVPQLPPSIHRQTAGMLIGSASPSISLLSKNQACKRILRCEKARRACERQALGRPAALLGAPDRDRSSGGAGYARATRGGPTVKLPNSQGPRGLAGTPEAEAANARD